MQKYLSAALFLVCLSLPAQQMPRQEVPLPENVPLAQLDNLYVDKEGFLWLSSGNQLYQYTGEEFWLQPIQHDTEAQRISAIYKSDTALWIGWHSGHISVRYRDTARPYTPPEGHPAVPIVGFAEDEKGRLWYATDGEGLYLRDTTGRWHNWNTDDGLPSNAIYALQAYSSGVVVATDGGLAFCHYMEHKKQVRTVGTSQGLADQIVKDMYYDGQSLWLSFFEPVVQQWRGGKVVAQFTAPAYDAHQFIPTPSGQWWLSERGALYHSLGAANFKAFELSQRRPTRIEHLAQDREGHLWVASNEGLFQIKLYNYQYPFAEAVTAVDYQDSTVYFAAGGRLHRLHEPSGRIDTLWQGLHRILSLHCDRQGRVWAGTFDGGAVIFNLATGRRSALTQKDGLANNNVLSIKGRAGEVWLGTLGGVSRVLLRDKKLQVQSVTDAAGRELPYVYGIHLSQNNEVFLATDGQGILKWQGQYFAPVDTLSTQDNFIDVCSNGQGALYGLSANGQLYGSTPQGHFRELPLSGFPSAEVAGLLHLKGGLLVKFTDQGLETYTSSSKAWQRYGRDYGLENLDPVLHAQVQSPDGQVYIGTEGGLQVVAMDMLTQLPPPTTQLRQVECFFEKTTQKEFAAHRNHLTFRYLGRWYINPEAVQYKVKLEGYDREWSLSNNTAVTYPRLAPGHYTFKVMAGVHHRFLPRHMQSYAFTICPPWYVRWYTLVGGLILLLLGIWGVVRLQMTRQKKREEQERQKVQAQYEMLKSQVNPHFLFNSFNTLMALIEDDKNLALHYLHQLSDFFRNVLETSHQDLIALHRELELAQTYLELQKIRFGANLQFTERLPDKARHSLIPPLTLQLLLENAFKHNVISKKHPLQLKIYQQDGYVVVWNRKHLKRQDDPSTGYGLDSIKQKYRLYTRRPVKIENQEAYFAVHLPLIDE